MGHSQLLARVNFPLYTIKCLSNRYFLVAGGGGGAKTGIRNAIEICELINNGSAYSAEPVTHYETGREAMMNSAILIAKKHFILFAGQEGNCQVYKIKQEVVEETVLKETNEFNRERTSFRKRTTDTINYENIVSTDTDFNANMYKLHFKITPLECFQTDFSEDPFQKLVKFSRTGNMLVTGGADGHIRVWKYPQLTKIFDIEAHSDDVDDLDICPSGKMIVSVSRDGHGKVYNSLDGSLITELNSVIPMKLDVRYIFRSCRFAVLDGQNKLALFTTLNPALRKKSRMKSFLCKHEGKHFTVEKSISTGTDMLSAMAISDDACFIGLGTQGGSIKIYSSFNLQLVYNVDNIHNIFVTCVEFLPASDEFQQIAGGHKSPLISVSVDNCIIIHTHHILKGQSMRILNLITVFILTLFLIFVITDFINL